MRFEVGVLFIQKLCREKYVSKTVENRLGIINTVVIYEVNLKTLISCEATPTRVFLSQGSTFQCQINGTLKIGGMGA